MKRSCRSIVLTIIALLALLPTPVFAAQDGTVVASAVVMPARIARLSFVTPGLVKEISVKEGDQVSTGTILAVLHTPDLDYNVIAAQEALRSAETNAELQRYKRVLDIRKGKKFWDVVPPEMRQKADAQVARAQAAVEIAQTTLDQSTLIAPSDATVASVDVFPGEFVNQNQTIITLASLDALQIETTDLSERDITRVKVGAPVDIFVEALNDHFRGKVIGISPRANTVGGDVIFKVTIAFDKQPAGLLWGMTAEVTVEA
jgi:RND family efflux transporter MFP subunit